MNDVAGPTASTALNTEDDDISVDSSLSSVGHVGRMGNKRSITKMAVFGPHDARKRVRSERCSESETRAKNRTSDSINNLDGDLIRKIVNATPRNDDSLLPAMLNAQPATRMLVVEVTDSKQLVPILLTQLQPHEHQSKRISMSPAVASSGPQQIDPLPVFIPKGSKTAMSRDPSAPFCSSNDARLGPSTILEDVDSEGEPELLTIGKDWQVKVNRFARFLQLIVPAFVFVSVVAFPVISKQRTGRHHHDQHPSSSLWHSFWGYKHVGKRNPAVTLTAVVPQGAMPLTLRDVLMDEATGFHLAMAPAFFGFYGYFGVLAAWYDAVEGAVPPIKSVAGASAGAMAAILLAAGILPQTAAEFCADMGVTKFADFPGFGAVFRGNKFEGIMQEFLQNSSVRNMEDAHIPVAVTAFDLQTMRGHILQTGSMARAARASATFPGLFQPVGWDDGTKDYLFIDGGIADHAGMLGLTKTMMPFRETGEQKTERVVHLCVGSFLSSPPPGPSSLPGNSEVISVSLQGLPQPGPWAMKNGPRAFEAARYAMTAALDLPLRRVVQKPNENSINHEDESDFHYELVIVSPK